jgi:hypothetical protein
MRRILVFLFLTACVFAQPVSVGVKAGVPFNTAPDVVQGHSLDSRYWTIGPTVELRLPARFAISLDALYRTFDSSFQRNAGSAVFSHSTEAGHWEFPLYLKYRFAEGPIQPFVSAGGALGYARTTGTAACIGDPLLCGSGGTQLAAVKSSTAGGGWLAGGGVEFRVSVFKIAPEVRYTRWDTGYLRNDGRNQAELLLGIRF